VTAPSIRSQTTSFEDTDVTTHDVALPATVAAGDNLVVFFTIDGAPTITWDNSTHGTWTQIFTDVRGSATKSEGWAKVADGTEDGGTLAVTSSSAEHSVHQSFAVQDVDTGEFPEAAALDQGTSSANPPSLNPTWAATDTLWFAFVGWASAIQDASTYPTNYTNGTKLVTTGDLSGVGNAVAQRTTNADSEDPGTFSMTATISLVVATVGIAGTATVTAVTLTATPTFPAASLVEAGQVVAVTLTIAPSLPAATLTATTSLTAVTLDATPTLLQASVTGVVNAATLTITPTLPAAGIALGSVEAQTLVVSPLTPAAGIGNGSGFGLGSGGSGWTMDIQGPNGGAALASGVGFKTAQLRWTSDGPGAFEIELLDEQVSDDWIPGLHRIVIDLDGIPQFAGYINRKERTGPPGALAHRISGNGLAWILDWRLIHKPQVFAAIDEPVGDIAWALIDAVQSQVNGDMGFTQGTSVGTTVSRDRGYCDGSNVGEEIRELASIGRGFDYEIDANGAFNVWNNTRGQDLSGSVTLTEGDANGWDVALDTSDLVTSVSAYGSAEKPWGPQRVAVKTFQAVTYGRREIPFDVDSTDEDELQDFATAQVAIQGGAQVMVRANWIEGRGPWSLGDVWLQDKVSVVLDSHNGGTQDMRCTDITVTLEPTPADIWFIEQTFHAVVEDLTPDTDDDI
jgi:hypothetical protein